MAPVKLLRLLFAHVPLTIGVLLLFAQRRLLGGAKRSVLVLTHAQDVDAEGRDQQMGPLVDALRARDTPLVRIVLVPLDAGAMRAARASAGEPFLSLAALYAFGRLVGRDRIAGFVLWLADVRTCFLIDESASGQMWVRAARRRGARSVGIQHGDAGQGQRHDGQGPYQVRQAPPFVLPTKQMFGSVGCAKTAWIAPHIAFLGVVGPDCWYKFCPCPLMAG